MSALLAWITSTWKWILDLFEEPETFLSVLQNSNPQSFEAALTVIERALRAGDGRMWERFINLDERSLILTHHAMGVEIRNNLGLWDQNSPLVRHAFQRWGLWHGDDISALLIDTLYRQANSQPNRVEELVQQYLNHWETIGHNVPSIVHDPAYDEDLDEDTPIADEILRQASEHED